MRTKFGLASCALVLAALLCCSLNGEQAGDEGLRLATFQLDVTPPLGSPLCNGAVKPALEIVTPLTARGVVLLGAGEPIVLCAFDWVGIGNESYDAFRAALAEATGTSADRVAVHTLHQHDAPGSDLATERLLAEQGLGKLHSNADFDLQVQERLAASAKAALTTAQRVTHVGLGSAEVERVASNRRILGPDGRVAIVRYSSSRSPAAQEAPEGTIDPLTRLISFWNEDQPLAVLTYYATHPQSYYGQGLVNWDFVGIARELREKALPGVPHIHFNGASGNVAAGKYNDGSPERRPELARRLADGFETAWKTQTKRPITAADVRWSVEPVALPVRETLVEDELAAKLNDPANNQGARIRAARDLIFLRRTHAGHRIPLSCLRLADARVLHMPGELFVEYQLAAQQMHPDDFVAMAAYGDYGPGYIGTEVAYGQGGYETGIVSRVAPRVEGVLTEAMRRLLDSASGNAAVNMLDENLVAWCIVPFDGQKRGPAERAEMIKRLGLRRVAYDWREQHVPTFEEEILQYNKHEIDYFAFWSAHEEAFKLFEKHGLHPQIWQTLPSPDAAAQDARVEAAARQLLPLVERTRELGCKLGLYNHGGWGGEPENLVAVCRYLRDHHDARQVGIVYNLHHGHGHIDDWASSLSLMQPYLLCLNLNGMDRDGDQRGRKIMPLGAGECDVEMVRAIRDSGYAGPLGIIGHTQDDVELRLRDNLDGLHWIRDQLDDRSTSEPPKFRTWR